MTKQLTNIALALVFVVIGLGALTRLLDAGLGCPDWPGCYGFLTPPNQPEHIELAEELYPNTPVVRHQAWMEMVHRYAAGTLGLLIFAITLRLYRTNKKSSTLSQATVIATVLSMVVIVQAAFGMWTVTLKLWPPIVTLHLLGGLITFGLLIVLRFLLQQPEIIDRNQITKERNHGSPSHQTLKRLAVSALLVVFLQITLGAWTSSNYAGLACPDFPTCQNQWFEQVSIQKALSIPSYDNLSFLHGRTDAQTRVSIQVLHRLGAVITLIIVGVFLIQFLRSQHPYRKQIALVTSTLLVLQIVLGILTAVLLLPLTLALLHNLVAALLFGSLITANLLVAHSQTAPLVERTELTGIPETHTVGMTKEIQDGNIITHNS